MSKCLSMNAAGNAAKTYRNRTFALYGLYVAINVAAIAGLFDKISAPASWVLALAVSIPVVLHIWAFLDLIRNCDEFLRALMAKRFIIASGITLAFFSSWGFLQVYAGAVPAPACLTVAIFWGVFGLISPFVQTTHA